MDRATLRRLTRSYVDDLGGQWIQTVTSGDPTQAFTVDDYLNLACDDYAAATLCFDVEYTKAAVIDQSIYPYSFFGAAGEGDRMLSVVKVGFNSALVHEITRARLDADYPTWMFAAHGTPKHWFRWGEGNFRLYPKPDATSTIYVMGYEKPDNTAWADDDEEPPVHSASHELLAVRAAYRIIIRNPSEANMARGSALQPLWAAGIQEATQRIHGANGADVVVGLRAQMGYTPYAESSETITRV